MQKNNNSLFSALLCLLLLADLSVLHQLSVQQLLVGLTFALLLISNKLKTQLAIVVLTLLLLAHMSFASFLYSEFRAYSFLHMLVFALTLTSVYSIFHVIGPIRISKLVSVTSFIFAISVIIHFVVLSIAPQISFEILGPSGRMWVFFRAQGLMYEPSQGAVILAPALIFTILAGDNVKTRTIIVACLLTFSSLTYFALALAVLIGVHAKDKFSMRGVGRPAKFLLIFLLIGTIGSFAVSTSLFNDRISGLIGAYDLYGYELADSSDLYQLNASAATLYYNWDVAVSTLKETYGLGYGFGNYRFAFNEIGSDIADITVFGDFFIYNRTGGGSLLNRTIAELGALGIIAITLVLFVSLRYYRKLLSKPKFLIELPYFMYFICLLTVVLIRKESWLTPHLHLSIAACFYFIYNRRATSKLRN